MRADTAVAIKASSVKVYVSALIASAKTATNVLTNVVAALIRCLLNNSDNFLVINLISFGGTTFP